MSINYSIAMLGNPIDEDAPKKAYAKSQYTNILTLDKFAGHIAQPRIQVQPRRHLCRADANRGLHA